MQILLRAILTTTLAVVPSALTAQQIIDLSRAPGSITQSVAPGSTVAVTITSLAPGASYEIVTLRENIPIPELKSPGSILFGVTDECEALTLAKSLVKEVDETKVAATVGEIDAKRKDCDADQIRLIDLYVGVTRRTVNVGVINAGEQARITVTKKIETPKVWTLVLTTGASGSWRTLYGVALGPGQDDKFFAKATANAGQFVITKERDDANEMSDLAVIPSVFFQWLPMTRELNDWAVGPTLGLGVKSDRPALFLGAIITFRQNLGLAIGLPVYQELKLRGSFVEGQTIMENLNEDQLHKETYRFQRFFVAGVFRFGSNPFAGGSSGSSDGGNTKQ